MLQWGGCFCDVHIHMDIPCIDSFCFADYELCAFGREKQSGSVIDVTCLSFFFLFFLSGLLVDYDYALMGYLFTQFIFMWCHVFCVYYRAILKLLRIAHVQEKMPQELK